MINISEIIICSMEDYIHVMKKFDEKIRQILNFIEKENIYNDKDWKFEIFKVEFDDNKVVNVIIKKDDFICDYRQRSIPYKYLEVEDKIWQEDLLKIRDKIINQEKQNEKSLKECEKEFCVICENVIVMNI